MQAIFMSRRILGSVPAETPTLLDAPGSQLLSEASAVAAMAQIPRADCNEIALAPM
jgi:hypothetical protein